MTAHEKNAPPPRNEPSVTEASRLAKAERDAKLADALRANLHRRKAQIRARVSDSEPDSE